MSKAFRLKPWRPNETLIVSAIMQALYYEQAQGRVCWANRMNSGATKYLDKKTGKERFVQFGFPGCPDIHGMMSDGRALYFEVKTETGVISEHQQVFMDKVLAAGAVGGIVRSADEAVEIVRGAFA